MTITLSKTKLAIAVFVVALLAPATALATHIFDDVDDSKFYAEPVEWAADNGITTGKTPTSFAPDDGVTRGEAVTFLKRYNDNVVESAIGDVQADADGAQADADANSAVLAGTHWVTIDADGSIGMATAGVNTDVAETRQLSTGRYEVDFLVDDVANCFALASLADTQQSSSDHGTIYLEARSGDTSSVYVDTDSTALANADRDFTLQLFCDPALAPAGLSVSADGAAQGDPSTQGLN